MRYLLLLLLPYFFSNCSTAKKTVTTDPTPFDKEYYANIDGNINRLHRLFQGSFVAHHENKEQWTVSGEGDSVMLLTQAIGEVAKHGHWVYNYDFMSALPNEPIYTSIKKIEQIDRDSFAIIYYRSDQSYTLEEMKQEVPFTGAKFDFDKMVRRDKKVIFVKKSAAHFIGRSNIYEDKQLDCLRQNVYEITPKYYKVSVNFFDKQTRKPLDKDNRPNFLLRRDISDDTFKKIIEKNQISKK